MPYFISLPVDFAQGLTAYVGQVASDVMPLIYLAIGLPLGFWFVKKTISILKPKS